MQETKELPLLSGLVPVAQPDAKILILGSMPGQASLDAQQYYGHPRNQFWPLMQQLFAVDAALPYAQRLVALQQAGVALWDVIGVCQRQGSLDSAIKQESVAFNPLQDFCQSLPQLQQIWLNGGKAASSFLQYQRQQQWQAQGIQIRQLPSTSPAHASLSFETKLRLWRPEPQTPA